ncbi:aminoglycoside phosphotransferase family protein [Deinococcus oregonensis]|uniref:Aminoglycoside phosphotransferase family protein n=1 Tax=Deinococcus oregonensis TaxID=1805970 RepID=A0ABV6AVS6_9DEIO
MLSNLDPAALLSRHNFPLTGFHRVEMGYSNQVWMTETSVICLSVATDHAYEVKVATGAFDAGVRTARPLGWGEGYSIWERLPGHPPNAAELTERVWREVLEDLERLHARPPIPPKEREQQYWLGDPSLVNRTQAQAQWTAEERRRLNAALGSSSPLTVPLFVHGDVYASNILINDQGHYVGLIDWGNARWATLEDECMCFDDVTVALQRWQSRLDVGLLWRVRLEFLMKLAAHTGRISPAAIREVLSHLQAHDSK